MKRSCDSLYPLEHQGRDNIILNLSSMHTDRKNILTLSSTLSELNILSLQNVFLAYGFHDLCVANPEAGRRLVQVFLNALGCYKNVACFTLVDKPLAPEVIDLYYQLSCFPGTIEEFLLDTFYYDFVWIELSRELLADDMYVTFNQLLVRMELYVRLPVVVMHYNGDK
jgi:hypothetical protein